MPNLILDERVVPELVQADATPENLARALAAYLDSPSYRADVVARLGAIRDTLVRPGAAGRAADLALEMLA
jgi:lipid-A-disaccharide synthase